MDGGRNVWGQGRRARERLAAWSRQAHSDEPSRADAHAALDALEDISLLRRLLDQAELAAVRTARRAGTSWAEIATMLGVTRQSAWERWRDLDEPTTATVSQLESDAAVTALRERMGDVRPSLAAMGEKIAATQTEALAAPLSRRRLVSVPKVTLLSCDEATAEIAMSGLVPIGPDPDIPLPEHGDNDHVVTDQSPESGARVPRGSAVILWTERRGGTGVREPRRPKVPPAMGRQLRDEASNQAVG